MLNIIERSPGRTIAIVGAVFVLVYLAAFTTVSAGRRPINGDAIQYYAYLRSIVFDRDLDFRNDYARLYGGTGDPSANVWERERTATGRAPNQMSIGPAIAWAPFYLAVYALLAGLAAAGVPVAVDGFSRVFQLSAGVAGIFYASLGAYLCYRVAALTYPRQSALWATLVAWLATSALYYSAISPAYSHAVSMCAVALFVFVWMRGGGRVDVRHFALLGALGALAALMRWQDAVVLILPAVDLARALRNRTQAATTIIASTGALAVAALLLALPQLAAWRTLYGSWIAMPQGAGFMQWTAPAILSVLLSPRHGLWLWTPAVLVASAGLPLAYARDRYRIGLLILLFAIAIYVNAAVSDWWAGEAFGARRFVGYTVIFTLGLAAILGRLESSQHVRTLRTAAIALIAYNALFVLQYQTFAHGHTQLAPYPTTLQQILVDRLILPFKILHAWFGA